jgi:hypothetical protein
MPVRRDWLAKIQFKQCQKGRGGRPCPTQLNGGKRDGGGSWRVGRRDGVGNALMNDPGQDSPGPSRK